MEPLLYRQSPVDGKAVWKIDEESNFGFHWQYLILTLLLLLPTTVTSALGTIYVSSADGTAISQFWPAAAFQIVLSIWFGFYGVIAGVVGPMLGNSLIGDSPFLFIPANAFNCCLAAFWFRYFKLDPRLKSKRDWIGLLLVCCVGGNFISASMGVFESIIRSQPIETDGWHYWFTKFITWFSGNTLPSIILAPALLISASPIIVRGPFFCQRLFYGITPKKLIHRYRFNDLPMIAKLMLLIVFACILPLSIVAAWSVIETIHNADFLAAQVNQATAKQLKNDIERHELFLRLWASELKHTDTQTESLANKLNEWQKTPGSFENLQIVDIEKIKKTLPLQYQDNFADRDVIFYPMPKSESNQSLFQAMIKLEALPGSALNGEIHWQDNDLFSSKWSAIEGIIIMDVDGHELHCNCPPMLTGWNAHDMDGEEGYRVFTYNKQTWNVAKVQIPRLDMQVLVLTSVKAGQAVILANIHNPVAILINLAIFGSLIVGSIMTRQISDRVLVIADHVRMNGAEPGKLKIPVRGQDELGFLGLTLNKMSDDLADYILKLKEMVAEKERLDAEMKLAREVQESILPESAPEIEGYNVAAISRPAREVGGDFFDFIPTSDGKIVFMIGDAVGKGLRAAMYVSETHGLAHAAAIEHDMPNQILTSVNAAIIASRGESSDFITLFCAMLDPHEHKLFYASAGHNPPILKHNNNVISFKFGNLPLAVMEGAEYELHEIDLAHGDSVVMYTDGITEAQNADKKLFGENRLENLISKLSTTKADETNRIILNEVENFVNNAPQSDDITLLTLCRS